MTLKTKLWLGGGVFLFVILGLALYRWFFSVNYFGVRHSLFTYIEQHVATASAPLYSPLDPKDLEEHVDQITKERRSEFYYRAASRDYYRGDFKEALRHLDRSKWFNQNNYSVYKLSGQIFFERNQYKKAYEDWSRAVQIPNGDQDILTDLSILKKIIRYSNREIEILKRAVFNNPNDVIANARLQELEFQMSE